MHFPTALTKLRKRMHHATYVFSLFSYIAIKPWEIAYRRSHKGEVDSEDALLIHQLAYLIPGIEVNKVHLLREEKLVMV